MRQDTDLLPGELDDDDKRRRKAERRSLDDRPLDAWERYRALADQVDHLLDLTEMADRRTRFALLIIGALNAFNLVVATRAGSVGIGTIDLTTLRFYVAAYVLLSLYLFLYAIITLRPRTGHLLRDPARRDRRGAGLRLMAEVIDQNVDEYYETWRKASIGQLNRELAIQSHMMARTTSTKYRALHRLYAGLFVLVVLTAGLVLFVAVRVPLAP